MKKVKKTVSIIAILSIIGIFAAARSGNFNINPFMLTASDGTENTYTYTETEGFVEKVNSDEELFNSKEKSLEKGYEYYPELDSLGRCSACMAVVGKETMPTEERGEIGSVKPSGWKQAKYPGIVNSDPPYLYNRCHLIAYCLTGENANERNLITGTRYFNVEGMLPFETMVAKYIDKNPENHVLYRVTPHYEGEELVARYVTIEAYSLEDEGALKFHVKIMNIQPGIVIDYSTGESKAKKDLKEEK